MFYNACNSKFQEPHILQTVNHVLLKVESLWCTAFITAADSNERLVPIFSDCLTYDSPLCQPLGAEHMSVERHCCSISLYSTKLW
jgi:hypothetical protein